MYMYDALISWIHQVQFMISFVSLYILLKSVNIANVWLSYWYLQCVIILLISPMFEYRIDIAIV